MGKNFALIAITAGVTLIGVKLTALYGIMGFIPTTVIAVVAVLIRARVLDHLEERELKRMYLSEVWGFVEHTRFEGDSGELERAQDHRDWLERVENDLDVPVLVVMFKENRPNEKWQDFLIRLGDEVREFKEKRDRELQKAVLTSRHSRHHGELTRAWYYRVALKKKIPERPKSDLEMEVIQ